MKIILDKRGSGKTVRLVVESHVKNVPIMTLNRQMVKIIKESAKWLGLKIPEPICLDDFLKNRHIQGRNNHDYENGILIDEAQLVLTELLKTKIHTITLTGESFESVGPIHNNSCDSINKYFPKDWNSKDWSF